MNEDNKNPLAKRGPGRPKEKVELSAEPIELEATVAETVGDEDKIELTGKELKALKALLEKNSEDKDEKFAKTLAEALAVALGNPKKSPAEEENLKRQQKQMRDQAEKARKSRAYEQVYCSHMAGNRGDQPHPFLTSIAWHEVHEHLWWGICTGCQREFWPNDPDYSYWRRKPSFSNGAYNKGSRAGERGLDVDTGAWVSEQHPEPFGKIIGATPSIPADIGSTVWNVPSPAIKQ